jgi:hypothetical protein
MIRRVKHPYKTLSDLERERIDLYKDKNKLSDDDVYVYYTTDMDLGAGYSIIIASSKAVKDKHGVYNFGPSAIDITDVDNLIECF